MAGGGGNGSAFGADLDFEFAGEFFRAFLDAHVDGANESEVVLFGVFARRVFHFGGEHVYAYFFESFHVRGCDADGVLVGGDGAISRVFLYVVVHGTPHCGADVYRL